MGKKLTEARVKRAHRPKTGQVFLWDTDVKGFGVRILSSGSKTFWFQYRPRGGSSRMIRIGPFPTISVASARKVARRHADQVAHGGNPAADLQTERMRDKATLRILLAEGGPYQRELERRSVVNIKPALSSLRRGLHGLMSKEVTYLTRRDLVTAIESVEHDGRPGAAQDLRRFTRVFLEWSVSSGLLTANPLAGLRRPVRSRAERLAAASNGGRALSDDEIRQLWQAAGSFGAFGGLVRLALLTGLRRGELAQIERARDLLADRIVVRPEHAKTGAQHEVPLTDLMRQVIAGAPVSTSRLLFPSPATGGRLAGWTRWVANLRQASGVDFRLHDLRRTARTLMSRLG
ncbi:MAG TPA: integrase family protein, partial [Burkholderiales bacterium]|nr:integrase family protein [Burkholderiales bacterium]